eukprot:771344-Pleurochrysis_carterae.AAC.1
MALLQDEPIKARRGLDAPAHARSEKPAARASHPAAQWLQSCIAAAALRCKQTRTSTRRRCCSQSTRTATS